MKLSPVLYEYLVANKMLELPGLGVFYVETRTVIVPDNNKFTPPHNIRFEQKKVLSINPAVIEFISKSTGKMKVLAQSDLDSQLDDVIQFLNTGKPYNFEGIGTLIRDQNGIYEFTLGKESRSDRKKEFTQSNETNTVPQAYIDTNITKSKTNKPAIIILLLTAIAIGATVWFYLRSTKNDQEVVIQEPKKIEAAPTTPLPVDTTTKPLKREVSNSDSLSARLFTFILETAGKERANKRYAQLKTLQWPVDLVEKDSSTYSIIMKLTVAPIDTLKIKDSLTSLSGKPVTIE